MALGAGLISAQSAEDLRLTIGKSVVIDYPSDVRQISTSNPDVIDASPVTTREILLQGKGLGSATMVVWSKTGQRTFYNVNVDLNLDPLRRMLQEAFPEEKIMPVTSRDSIVLNGQVSSKEVVDRAAVIAAAFAKTVVNNLSLNAAGIDKQILLRVKFAELDRSRELQYGVNLLGIAGQTQISGGTGQFSAASLTGNSAISGGSSPTQAASSGTAGTSALSITKALSIFAFNPNLNLGAFIQALQKESILEDSGRAESGRRPTARKPRSWWAANSRFRFCKAAANSGAVTIQFREFGIKLIFTPVITANKTIKMHLKQEVSTLDFANGVTINGFTIPALSTRRAETDVELGEGQSFVIAGLVDNRESDSFSKIPLLSSLPIFGALFKSKDEKKQRTDLVVLVTPEITEPLGANDPKPGLYMPKDFLVRLDPNSVPPQTAKKSKKN